jgi:hypothetical protein
MGILLIDCIGDTVENSFHKVIFMVQKDAILFKVAVQTILNYQNSKTKYYVSFELASYERSFISFPWLKHLFNPRILQ